MDQKPKYKIEIDNNGVFLLGFALGTSHNHAVANHDQVMAEGLKTLTIDLGNQLSKQGIPSSPIDKRTSSPL